MSAAANPDTAPFGAVRNQPDLVDVCLHAQLGGIEQLTEHLDASWNIYGEEHRWRGPTAAAHFAPPGAASSVRPEWRPADDRVAASDVGLIREHVLDPLGVQVGILNCYTGIDVLRHPGWSEAVVRAINDWMIADWLDPEPRLRASIVLPARDPAAAVAEIERVGDHPGFVGVSMPVRSDRLYGAKAWHPVYAAAERLGLVMAIHRGGHSEAASPSGWPSWFVEEHVAEQQIFAAQLTSLVSAGVFELFPALRVTLLECGFTWLPAWWWRMDADWRGLRREVPWLTRPPSEIIRDHVRLAAVPGDLGPPAELARTIDWLESEELLMFATDYPRNHREDFDTLLAAVGEPMRSNLLGGSARAWYGL